MGIISQLKLGKKLGKGSVNAGLETKNYKRLYMESDRMRDRPRKVAVLGGGMSALTAVFRLSSDPDWQEKYDITVYQMGWRLGGKGASGRNPDHCDRIEEHGLHVWFGCYDNAWQVLRACYAECGRQPGQPLATLEEAFEPAYSFVGMEHLNQEWHMWPMRFPSNEKVPGTDTDTYSIWDYVKRMVQQMTASVLTAHVANAFGTLTYSAHEQAVFKRVHDVLLARLHALLRLAGHEMTATNVYDFAAQLDLFLENFRESGEFGLLATGMRTVRDWIWEELEPELSSHAIRRMWLMCDLIVANLLGMLKDGVLYQGFSCINQYDYRDWVKLHCKTPELTGESTVVQAFYSVAFAGYKQHSFEAGTALKGALRIAFAYKGAYFYRMNAGMGDVVFGPLYQVLRRRGVKFAFFHKVQELQLSPDRRKVDRIRMDRQATVQDGDYAPLVQVKGLDCWPSQPLYAQLVQGDALKAGGVNLESDWADWTPVEQVTLQQGSDFDTVILGISLAALPRICPALLAASPAWEQMCAQVKTTPTLAFQAWLLPEVQGLGWPLRHVGRPLAGTFSQPLDTQADMGNLLPRESWPATQQPGTEVHFCGKLPLPLPATPAADPDFPAHAHAQVMAHARRCLNHAAQQYWSRARLREDGFDLNLLAAAPQVDGTMPEGEGRFHAQYFRANIDATEQYVLSEAGTSQYRLKAGDSGFENLVLAGDWIDTGFNVGCIEAAAMAGLQAARAVEGSDDTISGEIDTTLPFPARATQQRSTVKGQVQQALFSLYKSWVL